MNDSLEDTVEPKSDQLNYDDLVTGPITVTIESVSRGDSEQPVSIGISGHRPYKPCKSMRRVLIAAWGKYGKDWVGKSLTLYGDKSVRFGGAEVGGIRISHMSHISGKLAIHLTVTRGKRQPFTVLPLEIKTTDRADKCAAWLKTKGVAVEQAERLIGKPLKQATDADFDAIAKHDWKQSDEPLPYTL